MYSRVLAIGRPMGTLRSAGAGWHAQPLTSTLASAHLLGSEATDPAHRTRAVETIERNVTQYVRQQRLDQAALNAALRDDFVKRGLVFNDVDQTAFRARLPGVYAIWKEKLGSKCWSLLEAEVGKLGQRSARSDLKDHRYLFGGTVEAAIETLHKCPIAGAHSVGAIETG